MSAGISERDWQQKVVDLARLRGWRVAHFRPARTAAGWRTPVAADGAGWPDLVMVRRGQLVIAEMKSERGRVTDEQRRWLLTLAAVPGVAVYVWRPSDWPTVQVVLAGTAATTAGEAS